MISKIEKKRTQNYNFFISLHQKHLYSKISFLITFLSEKTISLTEMIIKIIFILLLIPQFSSVDCNLLVEKKLYSADEMFECIDQFTIDKETKTKIIDEIESVHF